LDISLPEGRVIESRNGGKGSFRLVMDMAKKTALTGYLRSALALEGHDSSGIIVLEVGRPIYAIYSYRPTGNESVEIIYRGEKAMEFVCGDSLYSSSRLELREVKDLKELERALRGRDAGKDYGKAIDNYFRSKEPEVSAEEPTTTRSEEADELAASILDFHVRNIKEKASPKRTMKIYVELEEGESYLIEEPSRDYSHGIFSYLIDQNRMVGLGITRSNPKTLRSMIDRGEPTILWLTDHETKSEETISPSLEKIMVIIEDFLQKNERPVILLDDLQYLISSNNFEGAVRFIRSLVDKISEKKAIFLLSMDPSSHNPQERSIIEREMKVIRSK